MRNPNIQRSKHLRFPIVSSEMLLSSNKLENQTKKIQNVSKIINQKKKYKM